MAGFTGNFKLTSFGVRTYIPRENGETSSFVCQMAEVLDPNSPATRGDDSHGLVLTLQAYADENPQSLTDFIVSLIQMTNPEPGKTVEDIALEKIMSGEWIVRNGGGSIEVI